MGHYASEMEDRDDSEFRRWLKIRNENDYVNAEKPTHWSYDAENTMMHHKPCGLLVGNMVRHLELCPAKPKSKFEHLLKQIEFSGSYGMWLCYCGTVGSGYRFTCRDDVVAEFHQHVGNV